MVPIDLWDYKTSGTTDDGGNEVKALFDGVAVFDNPKPTKLIRRMLGLATSPNGEDIVLDFFAGSGSTGHAVWLENAEDGGNRRFILVQLPERVDSPSGETIDKITCERLRRASKQMKKKGITLDLGFQVYRADSPALARSTHIPEGALMSEERQEILFKAKEAYEKLRPVDLFVEVLLLLGFPLDAEVSQVPQGTANTLWRFEHPRVSQPLLLCLDGQVDGDLADVLRQHPSHTFVCRDGALTDQTKARLYDALKVANSTFKVL